MGLLSKLLHRPAAPEAAPAAAPCPHIALVPRWDNPADMGKEDMATGYHCDACGQDFTAAEGRSLRSGVAERLPVGDEPAAST